MAYRRKRNFRGKKKTTFGSRKVRSIPSFTNRITRGVQRSTVVADESFVKLKRTFQLNISNDENSTPYFDFHFGGNTFGAYPNGQWSGFTTTITRAGVLTDDFPAGLQNWSMFYEKYRILGSKIKIDCINGASQTNNIVGVIANQHSDNRPPFDFESVMDHPYCKYRMISGNGGNDRALLKAYMKTKKMFGRPGITTDDSYAGTFTYNSSTPYLMTDVVDPVNIWDWIVFGVKPPGTDRIVMNALVTITYYCRLERRRPQLTLDNPSLPN